MDQIEDFEMDRTGRGSPLFLVPEVICVNDFISKVLANAGENMENLRDTNLTQREQLFMVVS